jgi:DNA topoisomerase-1
VAIDVPVNRDLGLLPFEEQVLVHIARRLIECGLPCRVETPALDLAALPPEVATLPWHRVTGVANRLWQEAPVTAGFRAWKAEHSLLHFMSHNSLGRPSTVAMHIEKFLGRNLIDDGFNLTRKGADWSARVGEIFSHLNVSAMIESYIDAHSKPAHEMVGEMVVLCGLKAVETAVQQQKESGYDNDEIAGRDVL